MTKRVVIIEGHPDPRTDHLCHALAEAYADGARAAGCEIERIAVGALDFPLLRTKGDFESGAVPAALLPCQQAIARAEHLLVIFPLWLGGMPAILKGFLEQTLRPGFAYTIGKTGWTRKLSGKSARIVVTMGMPSIVYRLYFGAHGLKSLKRSILGFCGISPIRDTIFGMVENASPAKRARWLETMRRLGRSVD